MTPRTPDGGRNSHRAQSSKGRGRPPDGRRRQIGGILLMVCGLLITLSIIVYTRRDEALLENLSPLDVLRLIWNSDVKARVGGIENRFGLFGALVSNFFINSTAGYASIVLPLLMLIWG